MDSVFGIGFPELLTILILAGVVMGPERIGRVARWLGKVTAQLQAISRAFTRQLVAELEGADADGEMRSAMQEIQDLQKQLTDLRQELRGQSTRVRQQGQNFVADLENEILPPGKKSTSTTSSPHEGTAVPNGAARPKITDLPTPLDIPDDPE